MITTEPTFVDAPIHTHQVVAHYVGHDLEAMAHARQYHQWILQEIRPFLGQSVLEVGAGCGNFSELLLECPIEHLWSIEPSSNMFAILHERHSDNQRISLANQDLASFQSSTTELFDSIVFINVLEHIEADELEMCRAFQSLKSGGHVIIFVPALQWLYSNFDREVGHFRRYHKGPLSNLVASVGFRILHAKYFDSFGILPWYLSSVLMGQSVHPRSVQLYDRYAVPILSRIERNISPWIGKNILLIGQK